MPLTRLPSAPSHKIARAALGQAIVRDFGGRVLTRIQRQLSVHRQPAANEVAERGLGGAKRRLRFCRRPLREPWPAPRHRPVYPFARRRGLCRFGRRLRRGVIGSGQQPGRNDQRGCQYAKRENARRPIIEESPCVCLLEADRVVRHRMLGRGVRFIAARPINEEATDVAALVITIVLGAAPVRVLAAVIDEEAKVAAASGQAMVRDARVA